MMANQDVDGYNITINHQKILQKCKKSN